MGGRGSRFGRYTWRGEDHEYGDEFETIFEADSIKFIKPRGTGSVHTPMETRTRGRIYAVIGAQRQVKSIILFGDDGRRTAQIDVSGRPHLLNGNETLPHTHLGYVHDENGTRAPTQEEQALIDKITQLWHNWRSRSSVRGNTP